MSIIVIPIAHLILRVAPIRQSNLCLEIALPTAFHWHIFYDEQGEIALCTLSAFNLGTLSNLDELEELADLVVRALMPY